MHTYDLYWSPEGRKIATVCAPDASKAIRKAPKPYRKYLGEIRAEMHIPNTYADITSEQYKLCRSTSYTGGSTWIKSPDYPEGSLVFAGTPIEIRSYFESHPNDSVRVQYVPYKEQ